MFYCLLFFSHSVDARACLQVGRALVIKKARDQGLLVGIPRLSCHWLFQNKIDVNVFYILYLQEAAVVIMDTKSEYIPEPNDPFSYKVTFGVIAKIRQYGLTCNLSLE